MGQIEIGYQFAILQHMILFISILNIVICCMLICSNNKLRNIAVPFLLYSIHCTLFYFIVIFLQYNIIHIDESMLIMTSWSSALRFQEIVTIFLVCLSISLDEQVYTCTINKVNNFTSKIKLYSRNIFTNGKENKK